MKTPERLSVLRKARKTLRNRDLKLKRLQKRLAKLTTERGINVEEEVQQEVEGMIDKHAADMHALPRTDFRRVFWDQQVWLMFIIIVYHYFL